MRVEALDHIHIYSAAPERSAAFYVKHFDATELLRDCDVGGRTRIFLGLGGQVIVLAALPPGDEPADPAARAHRPRPGLARFGLRVASVTAAMERLRAAGVPIRVERAEESTGLVHAYVEAPDGVVVELTEHLPEP